MKLKILISLLSGAWLILMGFFSTGGATDLTGTITDSVSGLPVSGVTVEILETGDSTATDTDGQYYFSGLVDGNYTLLVGRADYQPRILVSVRVGGFICGDMNGDTQVNVGDPVFLINYIFKGGAAPNPLEAADVNADSQVNVGDAVYMINYIFRGGVAPQCL